MPDLRTSQVPKTLSVIIPVYNECETVRSVVDRVLAVRLDGIDTEIVLVNDGRGRLRRDHGRPCW